MTVRPSRLRSVLRYCHTRAFVFALPFLILVFSYRMPFVRTKIALLKGQKLFQFQLPFAAAADFSIISWNNL